ncbi:MAG: hypothetical protein ACXWK4_12505 [Myxococcaceae bacterium]
MAAYNPLEWHELFVATAGASAALAGLVFVAVSINIERILKFEELPSRAEMTLLLLITVLLVSIIGLIPGQSRTALGAQLLGEGLILGAAIAVLAWRSLPKSPEQRPFPILRYVLIAGGTLPFVIGAASILAESGGGLYWTVGGIVFAVVGGVLNAWVLLVEILR